MKELLLEHGQKILSDDQKNYILNTGKLPEINQVNINCINSRYIGSCSTFLNQYYASPVFNENLNV